MTNAAFESPSGQVESMKTPVMDLLEAMASKSRPRPFEFLFPLYRAGDWLKTEHGPQRLRFDVGAANYYDRTVSEGPAGESHDLNLWKDRVTAPQKLDDMRYEMVEAPRRVSLAPHNDRQNLLEYAGVASRDKETAPAEVRAHYGERIIASVPRTRLDREDHCDAFGLQVSEAHLLEDGRTVILREATSLHGIKYHVRVMEHPPFNEENLKLSLALEEKRRVLYGEVRTEGLPSVPHLDKAKLSAPAGDKDGAGRAQGH
jgi:hypothetical protein